jgi:AhpD family alkylhydroperoxidase
LERFQYKSGENVLGKYENTLKDIQETLGMVPGFMKAIPKDVLMQDWPLMKKYQAGESEIPAKYREFIGLAIAANIKCPYCTLMHTAMATLGGATDKEMAEVAFLASFTARWSAMLHALQYNYDTFSKEVHQIGAHAKKAAKKK